MITGDKQETAVNIAVACRLVLRPKALLRCNAPGSAEAADARLSELLAQADREAANGAKVCEVLTPASASPAYLVSIPPGVELHCVHRQMCWQEPQGGGTMLDVAFVWLRPWVLFADFEYHSEAQWPL